MSHDMNVPVWIRHVVVPGLTDSEDELAALGKLVGQYDNVKKVELLPFSKIGEHKWVNVSEQYTLAHVPSPTEAEMIQAQRILEGGK